MSEQTMLDIPLSLLNSCGYFLPRTTRGAILKMWVFHTVVLYAIGVSIIHYFYTQGVIFDIVDNMEGTLGMGQLYARMVYFIFYKNEILCLLQMQKKFWSAYKCTESTQKEVTTIKNALRFIQKFYFSAYCFTGLFLMIPIEAITHHLAVGIWKFPDHPHWFWFSFVFNALTCMISCGIVATSDTLFLGLCYEVIVQFKILGDHLKRVSVENVNSKEELMKLTEELNVYVEYHNFLLRFVSNFRDCYSVILLIQYMSSSILICAELYATFESPSISKIIQHGLSGFILTGQFSIYCIPTDFMLQKISSVSNKVYNSNWYAKHFPGLSKSTQLIIQRGQQEIRFTVASGIADLNCKTLLTVVMFSFSFCTLLRNLRH